MTFPFSSPLNFDGNRFAGERAALQRPPRRNFFANGGGRADNAKRRSEKKPGRNAEGRNHPHDLRILSDHHLPFPENALARGANRDFCELGHFFPFVYARRDCPDEQETSRNRTALQSFSRNRNPLNEFPMNDSPLVNIAVKVDCITGTRLTVTDHHGTNVLAGLVNGTVLDHINKEQSSGSRFNGRLFRRLAGCKRTLRKEAETLPLDIEGRHGN